MATRILQQPNSAVAPTMCIWLFALSCLWCTLIAQSGLPIIRYFPPAAYSSDRYVSSPQNFAVIQDDAGLVYVANASGILVFDGNSWEMIAGTENMWLFKFGMGKDGRIFTGGIGDLGYLAADSTGKLRFWSIKEKLPGDLQGFDRVTRVESDGDRTWFIIDGHLCTWDGSRFREFTDLSDVRRVFCTRAGTFATRKDGLYSAGEHSSVRLDGTEQLADARGLFHDPGSGKTRPEYIAVTRNGAFFRFDGKNVRLLRPSADSLQIYNCELIGKGAIALGTNGKGIRIADLEGNILDEFDGSTGAVDRQVVFPYRDREKSLWTANFKGVSRISYPSAITLFDKRQGVESIVTCITDWNGLRLAGTVAGLQFIAPDPGPASVNATDIIAFLEDGPDLIMVAANGIFIGRRSADLPLFEQALAIGVLASALRPRIGPGALIVGTASGDLLQLRRENGAWSHQRLATLSHYPRHLAEAADGTLWASHDGITRIEFPNGPEGAPVVTPLDSTHGYTDELGLIEVSVIGGRVVFGTEKGIYRFDEARRQLVPDATFGREFADGSRIAYNLTETRAGDVWVTTNHQTGILRREPDGGYVYDSLPIIRAPVSDIFSIYEDPDGVMWFGGTEALVRYDPTVEKDYRVPFHTLIRRVILDGDNTIFFGHYADSAGRPVREQPEAFVQTFPFHHNHLTFEFSAPFFDKPEATEYTYQLTGQDREWSSWSKKRVREYTNLPEGSYTFRVRARNVYGTLSAVAAYRFRILPPWYRTPLAYAGFGLTGILMIWGIVRLNTRRLVAQKRRLEGIVRERTAEIRKEQEISEDLLHNILPKETAAELKREGRAIPKRYELVTVLFTDFKGFTGIAEQLPPEKLVEDIHTCFSRFDRIAEAHGVEKIKTIGDAYMCAGGLPNANDTNPVDVVRVGLRLQEAMAELNAQRAARGEPFYAMRVGIHSGPVVAGIVGLKKFQYDIWGDTVNTAARMESSGEPGRVNISEATYALVKDHFECTYRGKVPAKNKGEIGMYFVERELRP